MARVPAQLFRYTMRSRWKTVAEFEQAIRAFLTLASLHRGALEELAEAGIELHRLDEVSPTCLAAEQMSSKCGCSVGVQLTVGKTDQIVAWAHGFRILLRRC